MFKESDMKPNQFQGMPLDTDKITTAREARALMREEIWTTRTTYKVPGFVQCNLVVLPKDDALEFLIFCNRNRAACPVLDITEAGDPEPKVAARGADLRTDLARYAVYENGGLVDTPTNIKNRWHNDAVAFLIGSSLTFDTALARAGVELSPDVWVFRSNLPTLPAGRFHGSLIVTLRFFSPGDAIIATQLTSRFPFNHGAPRHIGDPEGLGIDLGEPIFGEPLKEIPDGKVGVYWDCGVTPQQVALDSGIVWMITHHPGHAFITDLKADEICIP